MARRRRIRGPGGGPWPAWVLVLIGLAVGLVLAAGTYRVYRAYKARPAKHVAAAKPPKVPPAPSPKPPKHKYDFYTILLQNETVIPRHVSAPPTAGANASYILQAASFTTFKDADRLKAKLALAGLEAQIQKVSIEGRGDFYRVRLGPYRHLAQLDASDRRLQAFGIKGVRLKVAGGK